MFISKCRRCGKEYANSPPVENNIEFKEEVTHKGSYGETCYFDVAAVDVYDQIVYGVEVYYGHKTDGTVPRKNSVWFECKALEVLEKLSYAKADDLIMLNECRYLLKCDDPECFSLEELAIKMGYLKPEKVYSSYCRQVIDEALRGKYRCLRGYQNHNSSTHLTTNQINRTNNFLKKSVTQVSKEDYSNSSEEDLYFLAERALELEIKIAKENKEDSNSQVVKADNIKMYWDIFLKRKCCLRCGKNDIKVTYNEPYCDNCFKAVSHKGPPLEEWFDSERKDELRNMLDWIKSIPKWTKDCQCYLCHRSYETFEENKIFSNFWEPNTRMVSCKVWWFGTERRICTVCLDREMREREIIL